MKGWKLKSGNLSGPGLREKVSAQAQVHFFCQRQTLRNKASPLTILEKSKDVCRKFSILTDKDIYKPGL